MKIDNCSMEDCRYICSAYPFHVSSPLLSMIQTPELRDRVYQGVMENRGAYQLGEYFNINTEHA